MVEIEVSRVDIGRKQLDKICEKILKEMLKEGVDFARATIGHVDTGATLNSIHSEQNGCEGKIVASGDVKNGICTAVWIEFGTGVLRNSSLHPKAAELGMSAHGTYGKGHGANPSGWWYPSAKGTWTSKKTGITYAHTKGIAQTRFMYETGEYLKRNAQEIANKVIK